MSDCDSSQSGSRPAPHSSPLFPLWLSDSDGRRSVHDGKLSLSGDESPWWESDRETTKQPVHAYVPTPDSSPISPVCNDNTSSSVTPSWWLEPSSHEVSSSETEVDRQAAKWRPHHENENAGQNENEDEKWTLPSGLNCRKRLREQSRISSNISREPSVSKMKLEPPSPPDNPNSVLENLKQGTCHPLQSFLLFFTADNLSRICDLTNANGWEMVLENPSLANKDGTWKEITVKELYVFIAVVLIMRQNQDVLFGAFWREDKGKNVHWPRTLMKRSRFFTLLQMLRFDEIVHETTEDSCIELSSPPTNDSNVQLERQTSLRKRFKIFFDQLEIVLRVFCHQYEVDSVEEIERAEGGPKSFRNYIKILSQPHQGSAELKTNACMENQHELDVNSAHTTTDRVCHGGESEIKDCSETSNARNVSLKNKYTSETKSHICKSRVQDSTQDQFEQHVSSSEKCNNPSKITSFIHVKWKNNTLRVTNDRRSPQNKLVALSPSANERNDAIFVHNDWQDVFIPCPELVYKNLEAGKTQDNTVQELDITGALETGALETGALETGALETGALETGGMFEKSYFYHYLQLAVYFAVSEDAKSRHEGSLHTSLDHFDPVNKIVDGLVLLAETEPVLQSDSQTEASETDTIYDSSTSSEDSADYTDAAGKSWSHKYVQARSRASCKCALCWSLHQEVRLVHTRCNRCERHFCVSRFRNCMAEAHRDKEIMKQLWDQDTGDKEDTNKEGTNISKGTRDKQCTDVRSYPPPEQGDGMG